MRKNRARHHRITSDQSARRARTLPGLTTLAVLVVLGLFAAAPASANCGGVKHALPAGPIDFAHRPPLAIGDSTMLLAVKPLARIGFEANSRGCRPLREGLALLSRLRSEHRLPKLVLIHLGANWGLSTVKIKQALLILGPKRTLVMVTPRPGRDARIVRAAGKRWPKHLKVLDWVRAHAGHPEYFSGDGLHLSFRGVEAYVRLCMPYVALDRGR